MAYTPPPPPPPPASSKKTPLGVPSDYTVERAGRTMDVFGVDVPGPGTTTVRPRYFKGAEYEPAAFGAEKIAQLQRVLSQVGLIGPKTEFRLGVWDAVSSGAYRKLLEFANANGVDQSEALNLYSQAPAIKSETSLPATRLTNPDDLRALVDTVARAKIGRKVDDAFVQRFVAAYHQAENAEAEAAIAAAGGGTYTQAPSPTVMVEQMLRHDYAADAEAMDAIHVGNEFFDLLDSTP